MKIFNETENAFLYAIEEASMYVSRGRSLEVHYEDDAWWAWEYSEEYGCAYPIERNEYDTRPLLRKSTAKKYRVDVDKVLRKAGCYCS